MAAAGFVDDFGGAAGVEDDLRAIRQVVGLRPALRVAPGLAPFDAAVAPRLPGDAARPCAEHQHAEQGLQAAPLAATPLFASGAFAAPVAQGAVDAVGGADDVALDGAAGDAVARGELVVANAFGAVGEENFARARRQGFEAAGDGVQRLAVQLLLQHVGAGMVLGFGQFVAVLVGEHLAGALELANVIGRHVVRHAEQVGTRVLEASRLIRHAHPHAQFLHQIPRIVVVAQPSRRIAQQGIVMALEDGQQHAPLLGRFQRRRSTGSFSKQKR